MARFSRAQASGRAIGRALRLARRLLVVLVLVVAAVFVGRWGLNQIDSKEAETTEVQAEIANLQVAVENYLGLEELRSEIEAELSAAQAALPRSPDLPGIIDQIVELADSTGVRLVSLVPSPPAPVSSPGADPSLQREVLLTMELAGAEEAVVGFVDGLGRLERVIVVDSVSMTWPGNERRAQAAEDPAAAAEGIVQAESPDADDAVADDAVEAPESAQTAAEAALDPDVEVIANLIARAFVWAPGAAVDRDAAEAVAGSSGGEAPLEEPADGGG